MAVEPSLWHTAGARRRACPADRRGGVHAISQQCNQSLVGAISESVAQVPPILKHLRPATTGAQAFGLRPLAFSVNSPRFLYFDLGSRGVHDNLEAFRIASIEEAPCCLTDSPV